MKKSNNKGITLIALVITIIVMLILVVVVINVATEGGLIKKAQDGKALTGEQTEHEELIDITFGAYNAEKGEVDFNDLKTALEKKGYTISDNATDFDANGKIVVYKGTDEDNATKHTINKSGKTDILKSTEEELPEIPS